MNKEQSTTSAGGVDVAKAWLDGAVHGSPEQIRVANTAEGWASLVAWFRQRGVGRVGLEASGGYEQGLFAALAANGLAPVLHQPLEIRLFARMRRQRAKNDRLDAQLIACATAQFDAVRAAADPRYAELRERLTAYEQAVDMLAQVKTYLEHTTLPDLVALLKAELASLTTLKRRLALDLARRIRDFPDLTRRLELVRSLPGVGPIVALSLVIRMPELGAMDHGQAAAMLGVAPFDRDSGAHRGHRIIAGGRARPRRMMYIAAMAAKRCDSGFKAMAHRLAANGKPPKVILVAIMRKLIEAANLILKRNQPWIRNPA